MNFNLIFGLGEIFSKDLQIMFEIYITGMDSHVVSLALMVMFLYLKPSVVKKIALANNRNPNNLQPGDQFGEVNTYIFS